MHACLLRSHHSRALILSTFALLSAATLKAQGGSSQPLTLPPPIADRLTRPIDESARVTLRGTMHPLATKANDRGAVSDSMKLDRIQIVLKRSDAQERALTKLIASLHTPGSSSYHKWLTPDDFGKQFGPSDNDVATLEDWLASHGFSIGKLNPGRQTLEISGTAGQFRDAFQTSIHSYQAKGETRFANSADPRIPAAIAPVFGGFASLNNFRPHSLARGRARILGKAQFNPVTHEARPDWTVGNIADYSLVLAPGDFAVQYDLNPLYTAGNDGSGQSIAIVNESNINVAEVNRYRSLFGLPANPPQVVIDGNDPGINGINGPFGPNDSAIEAYIDVEMAGSVAPAAQINLVIASDTALQTGFLLAAERAVYSNLSPVISMSIGDCEAQAGTYNAFFNNLWEQAAAQGITVLVSAGDNGSAGCDDFNSQFYAVGGQAVNGYASTPFNVAVGGTDFSYPGGTASLGSYWNLNPTPATPTVSLKNPAPEQVWNDSQYGSNLYSVYAASGDTQTTIAAGSGGASSAGLLGTNGIYGPYPKPAWQTGTGVPSDNARDLPDLSLFAGDGQNSSFYPFCAADGDCEPGASIQIGGAGGTSFAAPAFAGIMALVNQRYGRQGQANYVLYPLATQYPAAFHDVTAGTNTVPCNISTVFDLYNNDAAVLPVNCQPVTSPLSVTDPRYGFASEGEIGFTANAPAYNASAGYDLASGLGSVDAYQLVTNWANIKFSATATTLSVTPNPVSGPIAHGTSVTISGIVSSASGSAIPTGSVALLTGSTEPGQQSIANFPLVSGSFTATLTNLPGGSYTLSAVYSGDSIDASSSSAPVQITISPEPATTALTVNSYLVPNGGPATVASGTSMSYGALTAFSAHIFPVSNSSGKATGSVTFFSGTTALDTAILNAESDAEYDIAFPPASSPYSITAKYSGDSSYDASVSPATTFTVLKNTPDILVTFPNANSSGEAINGQITYIAVQIENSASVNGLARAPSGTLTVSGAPAGVPVSATLVPAVDPYNNAPQGTAFFPFPASTVGLQSLTFTYSGDTNYATTSVSGTLDFAAGGGLASMTTAAATALTTSPTAPVQVTVTVTGSGGTPPTGTVALFSSEFEVAGATLPASTGNSVTVTLDVDSQTLFPGTNQITVQYFPDATAAYSGSAAEITISNPLSDFSLLPLTTIIAVPGPGTAAPGVQTDAIDLGSSNGFAGTVALTCSSAGGVVCSLNPTSAVLASGGTASTSLTVNTAAVAAAGAYSVLVTGTDSTGNIIHTIGLQAVTPLIAAVATPGFTLAGPSISIAAPGDSGTSIITAAPVNSFTGAIALTCAITASPAAATGAPTCSISPGIATITGTAVAMAVLNIGTGTATTAGSYTVAVTGASGALSQTALIPVTVAAVSSGSFTLAGTAISIAAPGGSGTAAITATPSGSFTGSVAFTCAVTAGPSGAVSAPTCALSPATLTIAGAASSSTLTVATSTLTTPGSYTVTVTGMSGAITQTAAISVTIAAGVGATGSIALTTSGPISIASQGASGTSSVSVAPSGGFTGGVALTCAITSTPSGATEIPTCSLSPASVSIAGTAAATSILTVNTTAPTVSLFKRNSLAAGSSAVLALLIVMLPLGYHNRRLARALRVLSLLTGFAIISVAGLGCGGGTASGGGSPSPSGGTTTGSYTITVTAMPTASTIGTQTASVTVAVN